MIKIIACSVWQEHPDVTMMRAYFGIARLPTPDQFEKENKSSYELLFAYDFTFRKTGAFLLLIGLFSREAAIVTLFCICAR